LPFYCMGPDLNRYFGKNLPPDLQEDDFEDEPMVCARCGAKYRPEFDENKELVLWPEIDCCHMCMGKM